MKKKILFIVLSLGIAFILYATLVTSVHRKNILIKVPVARVQYQLSTAKSISKWYLPFATQDTVAIKITGKDKLASNADSLRITRLTGLSAWYKVSNNNATKDIVFDMIADTAGHTNITLRYESNLWNIITGADPIVSNAEKSLLHLKEYFEDIKKMYGYEMEVVEVTDTTFLFTSKIAANNSKKEALKSSYESLIKYAKEKNMDYSGTRIFYSSAYGNDSTHLFMSIEINNTTNASITGEYTLKKMPYKGRLLSAYYQGSFGNVLKPITAMEQFKIDNGLTSMAIPFIKIITEGVDFDDAQIIQAKAYYPVY